MEATIISELHSKFSEKTWNDTFQLVRRCMDKTRDQSKPCEPLIRCMQRLQEVFNVSSINVMQSRLEMIAKQQGLGFHVTDGTCYLTADLFYLEVVLLPCGVVEAVKVAPHRGSPVPSESFLELLRSRDFVKFSKKLGDLFSQYNIPGDNELKLKLFDSLQNLGKDLQQISQLPRISKDPNSQANQINNGIVGSVVAGKEDCPLTVQFYISPSDTPVADLPQHPDTDLLVYTAHLTIGLSDVPRKLQVGSSISQPPQMDTQGYPMFKSMTEVQCDLLPACFLLKLQPAIAMIPSFLNKINQITDVPIPDVDLQWAPLPHLLRSSTNRNEETPDDQDLISTVSFPESRMHSYIFPRTAWEVPVHRGTLVDRIPFTHLSHVPALLELLRHQCTITSILKSAIRTTCTSPSLHSELHFEVLPETDTSFTVTFARPDTDSLAVLVLDVPGSRQVSCRLFGAGLSDPSMEEHINSVMTRCLSLPMTLQTLYSKLSESTSIPTHPVSTQTPSVSDDCRMDTAVSDTVPRDSFSVSTCYASVSASQSEILPKINSNPPISPYPLTPVGVFSPWMANNSPLSEFI